MSSMKCTIPGVNLKVFGRALQSLSKIGEELYFEPLEEGLFLRSVNSSRSAYACFHFLPSFFLHYTEGKANEDSGDDNLRCKVGMKSVMAMFKSLPTIDKTVEKCRISLNMTEARLVFQMYCRHGIIKTHNLAFIECETLQAVFSKEMCPNKITAAPKLFCDAVLNFQNNQEEITLIVRPDFLALKNYVDDEPDSNKVIYTQLTLSPNEFDLYQVGVDTDITFCLKEFRAVLMFVDITGLQLTLQFEGAGRPITFSINSDLSFEANYVLATLSDVDCSQADPASQTARHGSKGSSIKHSSLRNGKLADHRNNFSAKRHSSRTTISHPLQNINSVRNRAGPSSASDEHMDDNDDEELSVAVMDVSAPEDSTDHSINANDHVSELPGSRAKKDGHLSTTFKKHSEDYHDNANDNNENDNDLGQEAEDGRNSVNQYPSLSFNDKIPERKTGKTGGISQIPDLSEAALHSECRPAQMTQLNLNVTNLGTCSSRDSSQSVYWRLVSMQSAPATENDTSPVIPLQDSEMNVQDEGTNDEEGEEEEIPATPPSKKFRSVFFGTQSSTQPSQSTQKKAAILAPDSDEDEY